MSKELFFEMREQEISASSGISFEHLLDAKKSNIQNALSTIKQAIEDGNYDSLKGLILAAKGKLMFTELEKELRPLAEDNYLNKLEKNYSAHDVNIDQSATKTEYDYTVCNDPEWTDLSAKAKRIDADKKARESFLKGLKSPLTVVDEETGEVYKIYPPNKLQKDGLKLTIK